MIRPTAKGRTAVSLTGGRARLFPLVNDLLAGRTDRVALSRRGADQDVLLVRARDVERMEAELVALRRRVAPEPRPLMGIGRIVGDTTVEEILADIRRQEREGFEAKLRDIVGDEVVTVRPHEVGKAPAGPRPRKAGLRRSGKP